MQSIKKNYFYNTALQLFMMVVPVITTPYLSRVIGADGIGTYSYYYAVVSYFLLFIKLGIDYYGNREVAECRDNKQELDRIFSELVYLQVALGVIVSIVYIVYSLFFSSESRYACLFFMTIVATVLDINWVLYGMEQFRTIAVRNAAIKILSTVMIFLLVKKGDGVFVYCLILNSCNLLSAVVAWPLVFRWTNFVKVDFCGIIRHIKPNMIIFISLLSTNIFKTMDKVMLGSMIASKNEVGFYETSERIIHIPNVLIVSLGTVMLPRISNMLSSGKQEYRKTIMAGMIFSMAVASSMSFGIMGVVKEFVPLFYGPGFEKNVILYLILLPCCLFMSFASVIRTQYLMPKHMDKLLLFASIIGVAFNLSANALLIPKLGSVGAAVATLGSEILVCLYQVLAVKDELPLKKYFMCSVPFVLVGVFMFVCIYFPSYSFIQILEIKLLIKVIIGFLIYVVGLYVILFVGRKQNDMDVEYVVEQIDQIKSKLRKRLATK